MKDVFTQVILPGLGLMAAAGLIWLDIKIESGTERRIMPEYYQSHQAYEGVHE